jgi:hypothetical protein
VPPYATDFLADSHKPLRSSNLSPYPVRPQAPERQQPHPTTPLRAPQATTACLCEIPAIVTLCALAHASGCPAPRPPPPAPRVLAATVFAMPRLYATRCLPPPQLHRSLENLCFLMTILETSPPGGPAAGGRHPPRAAETACWGLNTTQPTPLALQLAPCRRLWGPPCPCLARAPPLRVARAPRPHCAARAARRAASCCCYTAASCCCYTGCAGAVMPQRPCRYTRFYRPYKPSDGSAHGRARPAGQCAAASTGGGFNAPRRRAAPGL